jgi:hypothetical protein
MDPFYALPFSLSVSASSNRGTYMYRIWLAVITVSTTVATGLSDPRLRAAGVFALFSCFAACGGAGARPVGPSGSRPVIAVSTFTATLVPPSPVANYFSYELTLRVSEIGGQSAATLETVLMMLSNGDSDNGCAYIQARIEPGATWDMATLGYCAPYLTSGSAVDRLSVTVTFIDDEGHRGTARASTEVVVKGR